MFKIGDKVRFTKAAEKRLPFLGERDREITEVLEDAAHDLKCDGYPYVRGSTLNRVRAALTKLGGNQ